jgi:hypothetical protein
MRRRVQKSAAISAVLQYSHQVQIKGFSTSAAGENHTQKNEEVEARHEEE